MSARATLLRELRVSAPRSRVDLAERTGISKAAVTRGIRELIGAGLILEKGRGASSTLGGKPPTLLELNPAAAAGVACMLEVGTLVVALADFTGRLHQRTEVSFAVESDSATVLDLLRSAIGELVESNPPERPLLGVGVGVPGMTDEHGTVIAMPHLPGWRGLPFADTLRREFRMPVHVENESRIQALAERWFGDGRDVEDFICLETGVGVSCGVVIGGRLWRGHHSLAGEVGHTSVYADGDRCYCDSRACWEVRASTTQLLRDVRTAAIARGDDPLYSLERLTIPDVVSAIDAGDAIALAQLERHAEELTRGICNLILNFDPQRIIIHGESTLFGERLASMLRERIRERFAVWLDYEPIICFSELGRDVGLAGAASLALGAAWGLQ
jgi:predicted NBD/HSP70 family sugar kinase